MFKRSNRAPAVFAGLTAMAMAGMIAIAPAQAQTVEDRLLRLEREMQNIERKVYTSDTPMAISNQSGQSGKSVQLAQAGNYAIEDRMNGLERQMTNLTGQVEELQIKLQQLTARLDKMTTDMEFRISQLEGGQGGAVAGAQRPPTGTVNPSPSQPQTLPPRQGQPMNLPPTGPLVAPQPGVLAPPQPGQRYTPSTPAPPPGQQAAVAPPAGGSVEQQYEAAQQMLRAAQYAAAEQTLRELVARNPRHQLAASAQYWLGETYYVRQDYQNAAVAFADGYKNYPKGNKAPDTLLKLGMSLAAMKKDQDACAVYDRLGKEYPTAPEIVRRRATEERRKSRCG